jgi:hypothetical protein
MSHHISGPRAVAEPIADITDLYAFPSPEHPGSLVLVLNTLPFAPPDAVFSDGLIYRFRLRPLSVNGHGAQAPFAARGDELVFDCVFSAPTSDNGADRPEQEGVCSTPGGETVSFRVNDERGGSADRVEVGGEVEAVGALDTVDDDVVLSSGAFGAASRVVAGAGGEGGPCERDEPESGREACERSGGSAARTTVMAPEVAGDAGHGIAGRRRGAKKKLSWARTFSDYILYA